MKCHCNECNGSGQVVCEECEGTGLAEMPLSRARIAKDAPNREELLALQEDYKRCEAQAMELQRLNPARAKSYELQLSAAVKEIESQANKLWKGGRS